MELHLLKPGEELTTWSFTYKDLGILRSDIPALEMVKESNDPKSLESALKLNWDWTIDRADEYLQQVGIKPLQTAFAGGWLLGQDAYLPQWEKYCLDGGPWECVLTDTLRASIYRAPRVSDRYDGSDLFWGKKEPDPILILSYDSRTRRLNAVWEYSDKPSMRRWTLPGTESREISSNSLQELVPPLQSWKANARRLDTAVVPSDWFEGRGRKYEYWRQKFRREGRSGAIAKFWRDNAGVEYRIFDLSPSSFAVVQSDPGGDIQQISHFRGVRGTKVYRPPSPPAVEIKAASGAKRWLTSTPVEVRWRTTGLVEQGEISINGAPLQSVPRNKDAGKAVATAEGLLLRVSAQVRNENGSAQDSLLVPAILPIAGLGLGTVLAVAALLLFVRRTAALLRRRRRAAKARRDSNFSHALDQVEELLGQGLIEDAEAHLSSLEKQYPERRSEILKAGFVVEAAAAEARITSLEEKAASLASNAEKVSSRRVPLELPARLDERDER